MKKLFVSAALALGVTLVAGCASGASWRNAEALAAETVEMQVDSHGRLVEVEYHISPDAVPAVVHAAMDRLHPGGRAVAAEKEYVGSTLFWELSVEVDGREVEAMFHPDGRLHSQEIEVPAADVPAPARQAVNARFGSSPAKWEEILDGDGRLLEYHAKASSNGMNYKIAVGANGSVLGVVREVQAEIEVPLDD